MRLFTQRRLTSRRNVKQSFFSIQNFLRRCFSSSIDRMLEGISLVRDLRHQTFSSLFRSRQADKHHRRQMFRMSLGRNLERLECRTVFASGDLLISEFMANPNSTDGNTEWIELVATKSINFATTPYSVVVANNGAATASGWIAGGAVTYGFNISSGSVNAGDVVYVGGNAGLINGPGSTALSALGTATYIRSKDVTTAVMVLVLLRRQQGFW